MTIDMWTVTVIKCVSRLGSIGPVVCSLLSPRSVSAEREHRRDQGASLVKNGLMSTKTSFNDCYPFDIRYITNSLLTCLPVGLTSSMNRAWRSVIAKVRVRFQVKPVFFRVFYNSLGCSYNCEDHIYFCM